MRRIRAVIRKEWEEVFRNRVVLTTFAILPLTFVVLALGTFGATGALLGEATSGGPADVPQEFRALCEGMSEAACVESYLATVYVLLFLMLPLLMPNSFAAYSVVGEKVSRTLEPLLATPIRTGELIVAKALAAVIPAVVATWLAVGVYWAALPMLARPEAVAAATAPHWILAVGVLAPLGSVLSVLVALMVSSIAREPRTAEMVAGIVITPLLLMLFGQMIGLLMIDRALVLLACGLALVVDLGLAWLAVQVFDREHILTRWR